MTLTFSTLTPVAWASAVISISLAPCQISASALCTRQQTKNLVLTELEQGIAQTRWQETNREEAALNKKSRKSLMWTELKIGCCQEIIYFKLKCHSSRKHTKVSALANMSWDKKMCHEMTGARQMCYISLYIYLWLALMNRHYKCWKAFGNEYQANTFWSACDLRLLFQKSYSDRDLGLMSML